MGLEACFEFAHTNQGDGLLQAEASSVSCSNWIRHVCASHGWHESLANQDSEVKKLYNCFR